MSEGTGEVADEVADEMADEMADEVADEFRPTLDSYNGPLDLMLYLIKRDEIDVFDIPISRVVRQYRDYLEILKFIDPNSCGQFLVMAANLMEIKSKLLLPRETLEDDEELEDPRLELVQQLLEYKKYKERALLLEKRFSEYKRRHDRPAIDLSDLAPETTGPVKLGNVTVWDLLTAFHRVQVALGQRGPVRVVLHDRPLTEYVESIEQTLRTRTDRTARFEELFTEAATREDAIGLFLALLEMAKDRQITIFQDDFSAPIEVRLRLSEEIAKLQLQDAADLEDDTDPAETHLLRGEGPGSGTTPVERN